MYTLHYCETIMTDFSSYIYLDKRLLLSYNNENVNKKGDLPQDKGFEK